MAASTGASAEVDEGLRGVFDEFDADKSGAIDTTELEKMIESLGMTVKSEDLGKWVKEADADGSGEIEYGEFVSIVSKAADKQTSGMSLGALIRRKKNNGPPMKWRTDDKKNGVVVDPDGSTASRTHSEGWGTQLLDQWLSTSGFDKASCLLEFVELDCECYVGIVGKNYNPGDWGPDELKKSGHAVCFHSAAGDFFHKGPTAKGPTSMLCKLQKGRRLQVELTMRTQMMTVTVLKSTEGAKGIEWIQEASVSTTEEYKLPVEVAVAVCFGPSKTDSSKSVVRIVGSSSERTPKPDTTGQQTGKSAEETAANADPTTAMALSMTT